MLVRRRGVAGTVTLGLIALIVACTTPYGEEVIDDSDASAPDVDSSSPAADGSNPTDSGTPTDAPSEGGGFEDCPPCSTNTCVGAGCAGAIANSCSKPFDITASTSVVAFVCPEASSIDFPQPCVPGGTTKGVRFAAFRMGVSTGPKGKWAVTLQPVAGSNTFVAQGSCQGITACSGGTNAPAGSVEVASTGTVMVGTTNALTTCQAIAIDFAPK